MKIQLMIKQIPKANSYIFYELTISFCTLLKEALLQGLYIFLAAQIIFILLYNFTIFHPPANLSFGESMIFSIFFRLSEKQ